MSPFDSLLDVQSHDTTLAQLHHRLSHLPEHDVVVALEQAIADLERSEAPVRAQEAALSKRQAAFEAQLHDVDTKITSADRALFGGVVTATRELQALEADLVSLRRRRNELEDLELEVLMEREPIDAQLARGAADLESTLARLAQAREAEVAARAAIETQAHATGAARAQAAATVEAGLLARYEAIRAKNNGIGVARLVGGICGSCRLQLASVELDRIRALSAEALVTCEECSAILVR